MRAARILKFHSPAKVGIMLRFFSAHNQPCNETSGQYLSDRFDGRRQDHHRQAASQSVAVAVLRQRQSDRGVHRVDIPTIFSYEGEEGFRLREQAVIHHLSLKQGIVMATGGGA